MDFHCGKLLSNTWHLRAPVYVHHHFVLTAPLRNGSSHCIDGKIELRDVVFLPKFPRRWPGGSFSRTGCCVQPSLLCWHAFSKCSTQQGPVLGVRTQTTVWVGRQAGGPTIMDVCPAPLKDSCLDQWATGGGGDKASLMEYLPSDPRKENPLLTSHCAGWSEEQGGEGKLSVPGD